MEDYVRVNEQNEQEIYDLVIQGGTVIDPRTAVMSQANLGIKDGKVAVVTTATIAGRQCIDAVGKHVAPGFIDFQSHIDGNLYYARCMALQGATTTIGGNTGYSKELLQDIATNGFIINYGFLVSHSFTLRPSAGLIDPYRAANQRQIDVMLNIAESMLAEGALGISFGLEFVPGTSTAEIMHLAALVAKYGLIMPMHIRKDSWDAFGALNEVIRVCEQTGVALQLSHLMYMVGMGMMGPALLVIDEARERGMDITADSGLYEAFPVCIGTSILDSDWQLEYNCDYQDILISSGLYTGQRCTKELYQLLREDFPNTLVTVFACKPTEIIKALHKPYVYVSTNAAAGSHQPGTGHPQDAGTFPRLLGRYVREQQVLSLMEAIAKITWLPAQRFGLHNKGWLGVGADADITIFDATTVIDRSDYLGNGVQDAPPQGIEYVIVNGVPIVENGVIIDGRAPGKLIRRK